MILDKDVTEDLMSDFAIWVWNRDFSYTPDELEDFFRDNQTTRKDALKSARHHGIFIASYSSNDELPPDNWHKFWKWIWK